MRKIIHSDFELDISNFKITQQEENQWFSDAFFSKYSFPFELEKGQKEDVIFGYISQSNSSVIRTKFDVKYQHGNTIEDGVLEVEQVGEKISCVLRYGYEQLPSFSKTLQELSLTKYTFPTSVDLETHANEIIKKAWPETTYNFPQIITDEHNDGDPFVYLYFKGIINNRENGVFLKNYYFLEYVNYNIIKPIPYLLHILERGFADSGLVLAGDILKDTKIDKLLFYNNTSQTNMIKQEEYIVSAIYTDFFFIKDIMLSFQLIGKAYKYTKEIKIKSKGKYRIIGNILLINYYQFVDGIKCGSFKITYRDQVILYINGADNSVLDGLTNENINVEFECLNDPIEDVIKIEAYSLGGTDPRAEWINLNINPITLHDDAGNILPLINYQKYVDLTKEVADIKFEEVVKLVKNYFNYGLEVIGDKAYMNRISVVYDSFAMQDYSEQETKFPNIKFNEKTDYVLKLQSDNKDFKFDSVYFDGENKKINYDGKDSTSKIEINAVPLPQKTTKVSKITTGYLYEYDPSRIFLIPYKWDGTNNYTLPNTNYLLPNIFDEYWRDWLRYRIKSLNYNWKFTSWEEDVLNLTPYSRIFCYNKYHLVKRISKTEISPELFDIEIDTETIE